MMNDFAKVLAGSRWLMDVRQFRAMVERIATATPDQVKAAVGAYNQRAQTPTMVGDVAVIQCCGPITYRNSWFSMWYGSSTIEGMQQQFRTALMDPAVRTIVFRSDTPGGSSEMIPEFADEIYAARGQKPIIAIADTMMCSAGFWLFSQVDTIYGPRSSGCIGSVGAYLQHEEIAGMLEHLGVKVTLIQYGENKTLGNPYEPLSEAAEQHLQSEVNECGVEFDTHVARGRNVTRQVVRDTFGQGHVFSGLKAKKLGMIDQIGTFDSVMAKLTASKKRSSVQASASTSAPAVFGCSCGINCHCQDGSGRWCDETCERCAPNCNCREHAKMQAAASAEAPLVAKAIDPDEDGTCPDGYELQDGMCHPVNEAKATEAALLAASLSD